MTLITVISTQNLPLYIGRWSALVSLDFIFLRWGWTYQKNSVYFLVRTDIFLSHSHPSKFSRPRWGANGEIRTRCIINMKRAQRAMTYLGIDSNSHREHCYLPRSRAVTMRQLTQIRSFLARSADIRVAGPRNSLSARSSARKYHPDFVEFSRILLYVSIGYEFYFPLNP